MARVSPFLLLGATCLLQAQSVNPAERMTRHLQTMNRVHVDFTQTRTLAALSKPLKTTGRLVVVKDRGVIWQVKKPLNLTYVIGPNGMLEVGPDGRTMRKTAKDAPMITEMGRIFEALLQGRWDALEEHFTVKAEGKTEGWKIRLTPRSTVTVAIKEVLISGADFIERIRVTEPSGDGMDLDFDHPDILAPLSEDERRLFER